MKQNKPAPPTLLFVAALAAALFIYLEANLSVEFPETTVLTHSSHIKSDRGDISVERVEAKISRKANADHSSTALRKRSPQIKSDDANTNAEMTAAAPIPSRVTERDSSSALSNPSHVKPNGTIVTAFYEGPSKHSLSTYKKWIPNMLSLQDPMIVFTTPSFAPFVQKHRAKHNAMHKTEIVLLDLNKTETANMFDLDFWKEQHSKDPKKERHQGFHVYWVWLSKLEFVRRSIEMNPFQSEFFAWVDMGYFRSDRWQGKRLLQNIPNALQEDQVFMLDHHHAGHVGGGFIGGYTKGLLRYDKIFYEHLKKRQDTFIGHDEPMMAESCLVEQNMCQLVASGKFYENQIWYYMGPFLILGQNETESLMYVPTVTTEKVQADVVNRYNFIKPPDMMRNPHVLIVVAHADDEVLWGGEYLLKEGQNAHVVVTSTVAPPHKDSNRTSTRYEEFKAVQEHLGFHGEFLDGVESIRTTELESHIKQRIQTLICGKNWERIITHGAEGEYGHPQHQFVHDAVLDAVRMCCRSTDKLFVFEPHPLENHVFSDEKKAAAKLYKSQERILLRTFAKWKEQIVPFREYDSEAASISCRDGQNPEKEVHPHRQCRLHEMFDFSSSNYTNALSLETFSGQGSGC